MRLVAEIETGERPTCAALARLANPGPSDDLCLVLAHRGAQARRMIAVLSAVRRRRKAAVIMSQFLFQILASFSNRIATLQVEVRGNFGQIRCVGFCIRNGNARASTELGKTDAIDPSLADGSAVIRGCPNVGNPCFSGGRED